MKVYADVLIVVNLIVDYFILSLSARFLKKSIALWRMLLSSLIGAVSSLYIFLPTMPVLLETVLKLCVCLLMCLASFGYMNFKGFLRCFSAVSAVSFLYGGLMIAVWYAFKPNGMVINNSVVYFNVSPIFLILFSSAAYVLIALMRTITEKNCVYSGECKIDVIADGNIAKLTAIIDTGNSVEDMFSLSEIIMVDKSIVYSIFDGFPDNENLKRRYRALPVGTVSGTSLLDGYRCDKAYIEYGGKNIELKSPILAVSKTALTDGYNAIVNPKIFE